MKTKIWDSLFRGKINIASPGNSHSGARAVLLHINTPLVRCEIKKPPK